MRFHSDKKEENIIHEIDIDKEEILKVSKK